MRAPPHAKRPDRVFNLVERAFKAFKHIGIPEAQNRPALRLKTPRSPGIPSHLVRRAMRIAIQFDDELDLLAGEIGNPRADGMLAPELRAQQLPAAQARPDETLGKRPITAQPPRAIDRGRTIHGLEHIMN